MSFAAYHWLYETACMLQQELKDSFSIHVRTSDMSAPLISLCTRPRHISPSHFISRLQADRTAHVVSLRTCAKRDELPKKAIPQLHHGRYHLRFKL